MNSTATDNDSMESQWMQFATLVVLQLVGVAILIVNKFKSSSCCGATCSDQEQVLKKAATRTIPDISVKMDALDKKIEVLMRSRAADV